MLINMADRLIFIKHRKFVFTLLYATILLSQTIWTKFIGNPVLSTFILPYNPAIDSNGHWAPDVVFDGMNY
jgi:hypothetical protein